MGKNSGAGGAQPATNRRGHCKKVMILNYPQLLKREGTRLRDAAREAIEATEAEAVVMDPNSAEEESKPEHEPLATAAHVRSKIGELSSAQLPGRVTFSLRPGLRHGTRAQAPT